MRQNAPRSHAATRRTVLMAMTATLAAGCARAAAATEMVIYKTPWCGCCKGWVTHMTNAGFKPTVIEIEDLGPIRQKHGVPFPLSSCHTGLVGGYVIEGHVPAADVRRLLQERPKAIGLTVPGMPLGSPGMESPAGDVEAYDTLLLLDSNGGTRIFARHV